MAIKKIKIGNTEHELQTTIANVDSLQSTLDGKAPKAHASSSTTYGVATTSNYGHVKISNGDVGTTASANGVVAGMDHTHSELAAKSEGAFFIEGGGTTDSTAKTSTWTGTCDRITEYYDGLTIRYKIGVAGQSTVTLNINGLGAKTVYRFSTTKLTTHFPVGSIIHLIYYADLNSGCWVTNDYDSNTNTYQRLYPSTTNKEYPITARYNTTTGSNYYAEYGRYSTGVTLNPSTNTITATTFKGALTGNADTATTATTATKLGAATVGSTAKPIYLNAGTATVCSVADSTSASAISTGAKLVTERDIYYGLPTINGKHDYTSSYTIFPPTGPGTAGTMLTSEGTNNPIWKSATTIRNEILYVYSKTETDAAIQTAIGDAIAASY